MDCPRKVPNCDGGVNGHLTHMTCDSCYEELSECFGCWVEDCLGLMTDMRDMVCDEHWDLRDAFMTQDWDGQWATLVDTRK